MADDLKKLTGISPDVEKKLNDLGIFHYSQIAGLNGKRRTMSAKRSACRAACRPGSPRRKNSTASNASGVALILKMMRGGASAPRGQGKIEMAEITAAMVKELREKTGAGMMDCKAALVENKGDMEAASDWLRKKGLSKGSQEGGRVAAEGLVGISARHQGRDGRGQLRDRLRRAQRPVPGAGR